MSERNVTDGGENPQGRKAIDRMVGQLMSDGSHTREQAFKVARRSAKRHDEGRGAKPKD